MIKYENIEVYGLFTEGFELSLPSPLSVKLTAGKMLEHEYPEIEFDVEADDELNVVYDVYLLAANDSHGHNVHVDRTELAVDVMPFYDEDAPLLHTILSVAVPPGTTNLSDIDITVRNVNNIEEEETTDEIPSEEEIVDPGKA